MDDDEHRKSKSQSNNSSDKLEMIDLDEKDENRDFDQ